MYHESLTIALILLASGVLVVALFRRLNLPPMLGYLLGGILIGPHALAFVQDEQGTRYLAEFGVVFLMFSIGLEFSLPQLVSMRRIVFGLGLAQVLATMLATVVISRLLGLGFEAGIVLGGIMSMSSTAIVSKMLSDRLELHSAHGRQIMGIALFQDLAVVPLLVLIPTLAMTGEQALAELAYAVGKAVALLVVLLFFGQRVMRWLFNLVASQKSSELFVLTVLLVTLGLAWLTEHAGLSLALGAFIAGILISETEYRYQVEDYIKPFRDVFLGLFFVTIGMMLNLSVVSSNFLWVMAVLVLLLTVKFGLIFGLARVFGNPKSVSLRSALALSSAGEFGFVLLSLASGLQLMDAKVVQIALAAMVLSMLAAPFILMHSDRIVLHFSESEWMMRAMALTELSVKTMAVQGHVIICGYGRSGQNLGRFLAHENIPLIALDVDPQRVRQAAAAGDSVVFGDAGRREVLVAAGLSRASGVVVSFADVNASLKILSHVRDLRPDLPVVVRTIDETDIDRLKEAGAAEIVPELVEGSLMLATHVMLLLGSPLPHVLSRLREVRSQRYQLMRGFFRGATDEEEGLEESALPRLCSILLDEGASAVGKTIGELNLAKLEVEVTSVRRRHVRGVNPKPDVVLEAGDVVVLLGRPEALAAAEIRLLQG
ncbi:MAG TPA: monovalent cation:proton antiporter-2 (CPA2) family protein [Burkholderiales bacterium]|nr:monovalent cation:proton antiporter-2 (CPA2) family protein [Burkholderiales bacterium]